MNEEDLLFTNVFISQPEETTRDNKTRNENFRRYYENTVLPSKEKPVEIPPNNTQQFQEVQLSRKTERSSIITIDTKDRNTNLYPHQNDFITFLGKTFFNVKSIKLVSTEIPNTDQVIKELPVELSNNVISWTNEEDLDLGIFTGCVIDVSTEDFIDITVIDHPIPVNSSQIVTFFNGKKNSDPFISGYLDGKREATAISDSVIRIKYLGGNAFLGSISVDFGIPTYSVTIKPGNYTASTITEKIAESLNSVRRRNGTGQYHFFEVILNLDTDIIAFDSVITRQLPNNSLATTAGSTTITVNSMDHGFKSGERVKMISVKSTAGIPSSVLNGDFNITVLDFNTFTYEINERAIDSVSGGGNVIKTGKNAPFRLLFSSENTKIQYNIGFPNEDSSVSIGETTPITTKSLSITNAEITGPNSIRITTAIDHLLYKSNSSIIDSITDTGSYVLVTTTTDHGIDVPQIVYLRNTDSVPNIDGDVLVDPMGPRAFSITTKSIKNPGSLGQVIFGGDSVKLSGLKTAPALESSQIFFVEDIPASNQIDIYASTLQIISSSIASATVNTEQIKVQHPSHLFNNIVLIERYTATTSSCKTLFPHPYKGSIIDNLNVVAGPVSTNTIDIISPFHGLETSDSVIILNSNSDPVINGTYNIQKVDDNTVRINFVYASLVPGTCTLISGDKVRLSQTNSVPRINSGFSISNRLVATGISTGTITSVLTVSNPHPNWRTGDQLTITGSDSNPSIDGTHYIQNVINTTSFVIDLGVDVLIPGTIAAVVNNSRFLAKTNLDIISEGTSGIVGRNQSISLYRVTPEVRTIDNVGGILVNALNNFPRDILSIIDEDSYFIRVKGSYSTFTVTSGGSDVTVSSILHGNRSIQYNTSTGDNTTNLFRSISLQGENYLFLTSPGLHTLINSSGISDTFAKLLLSSSPGEMIYNGFVSAPKIFDPPIAKLDTLKFSVLTSKGFLFNFNDIDYSISLEVVELIDSLKTSEISSRSGNNQYDNLSSSSRATSSDIKNLGVGSKSGSQDTGFNASVGFLRAAGGRGGGFK